VNPYRQHEREFVYLNVDEVLALGNDLNIGIMNGLLVVLDSRRPVCCRPQNLRDHLHLWAFL